MSNSTNDTFLEGIYDRYWGRYTKECKGTKTTANISDFLVWLDDHDLIPEPEE